MSLLIVFVYFAYPLVRYSFHNFKEDINIPDDLFLETSFTTNNEGHFCLPCTIKGKQVNMIVDTKAMCLMKKEDIAQYRGRYFSTHPISSQNVQGQKHRMELYSLSDFRIASFSMNPLFGAVTGDNYIYHLINEGVLGNNFLRRCNWKFINDNKSVHIFSGDTVRLQKESYGFTKITNGLEDGGAVLNISGLEKPIACTLDLGSNVDLLVNNETADKLKKQYPFKTIRALRKDNSQDSFYLFEGISIYWNKIPITDCQIVNKPNFSFQRNFIGAGLMHRFNFILEYSWDNNLYIQPCQGFEEVKPAPVVPAFGLNITERENRFIIHYLEQNGIAEKAGVELGDEVLALDSCAFTSEYLNKEFVQYTLKKKEITIRIKNKGELRLSL